jgi:phosphoglucomutase
MENEELLKEVTAKAQTWLGAGFDAQTRQEVQAMLDNADKT